MEKKIFLFTLAVMLSANLFAQRGSGTTMFERRLERMKEELSLSEEQVKRLTEANEKFLQEHSKLRTDTTLTRSERMERQKGLMETREKSLKEILTEDQYKQWMASGPGSNRQPAQQRRRVSPIEQLKTEVGVSEDVARKIMAINTSAARQMQSLRSDTTMTDDERKKARQKVTDDRVESLKKIMTKEQYEKFVAYEKKRVMVHRRGKPSR